MKRQKGFTLIELLVVIAIIGILSAIVLASLNSARTKAQDARVQSELSSLRASAEIYYASHEEYSGSNSDNDCSVGFFADATTGAPKLITDIKNLSSAANVKCASSKISYAMVAKLPSNPSPAYVCVDSSGSAVKIAGLTILNDGADPRMYSCQ